MSPTNTSLATSDGPGDIVGQVLFVYDESGHLLGEYDEAGQVISEYVWLGDRPVAMLDDTGNAYFIHIDHLNTPKVVTDQNQQVVWKGDYTPFGEVEELTDTVEMNLRFPGQYEDHETGLNYNYFRSYNAAIGRYTQSDPVGLRAGINTYVYVNSDPNRRFDFLGLNSSPRSPNPSLPKIPKPILEVLCAISGLYTSEREGERNAWKDVNERNLRLINQDCNAVYMGCGNIESPEIQSKCIEKCTNSCADQRKKQWDEYLDGMDDIDKRLPPSPFEEACEYL